MNNISQLKQDYRICSRGVWDSTVPGIRFDKQGVSNYAHMFDALVALHPKGEEGLKTWNGFVTLMKKKGVGKSYDCVIGVSGGTDSSYLLWIAKQYGVRPLAVTVDNGWSSEIAVKNIKKVTDALGIDLETLVIDYEEVKIALRAFMKASMPWIDAPTDMAIKAGLYKIADREKIKFVLNGGDFRSEGKQPIEWTYSDARQLRLFVRKFEQSKLKTFPYYTLLELVNFGLIKNIKQIRPYLFLEYKKREAQEFLVKEFNWEYYGGHHHENLFTKFAIANWLPKKFNIDKRIITLSAQVLNGEISRDTALDLLHQPPCDPQKIELDKELVIKKLDLSHAEFEEIWNRPNKFYFDYPSYVPYLNLFRRFAVSFSKFILPFKPTFFTEQEFRK